MPGPEMFQPSDASDPTDMAAPSGAAPHPFEEVVARLQTVAEAQTVTLRDLIEAGGRTSFVPAMMIPAVIVVSPLSGIPFLPSIMGLTIALIAGQLVLGREHVWLPDILMRRRLSGARLRPAMRRMMGLARWIDRHTRDRLGLLTSLPLVKVPQALAMFCGLAMPTLELVPFSSSILGMAVLFFAAGFLSRDGLYVLAGAAMIGLAAMVPVLVWVEITD